jgi:hypothetical protein
MPYIKPEKRDKITETGGRVDGTVIHSNEIECAGDLNYAFTMLAIDYYRRKGLSYQSFNDIVGAFVCAKDEFERRVVAPYEQDKIEESGDVYPSTVTPKYPSTVTPKYPSAREFNGS